MPAGRASFLYDLYDLRGPGKIRDYSAAQDVELSTAIAVSTAASNDTACAIDTPSMAEYSLSRCGYDEGGARCPM